MPRTIAIALRCFFLLVLSLPGLAAAQAAPARSADAERIASARDRVLPVVVSILTVRQDFQQGEPVLSVASGSGTVISAQGHVATNAHVTQNGKSFRVIFADGRELPAKLIGTDTLSDLAVLQVQTPVPETFKFAEFADTLELQPGDTVLAMGAPWGLSNSMSVGVVNNPRRLLVSLFDDEAEYEDSLGDDQPTGRYYAWIQHDAAIAPGNSGGPLVDLSGHIVGVNTRGMILGGDLAFAIPGPDAGAVVKALIRDGRIVRATLGLRLRSLKGTGRTTGILVNAVERGSQAEKAGLKAGDCLLSLQGQPVSAAQAIDVPAFQRRIAELPIGQDVVLQVDRGDKAREVHLRSERQSDDRGNEFASRELGLSATPLTPAMGKRRNLDDLNGLLITGVRPGGPAAVARPSLQAGDVLRRVGGRVVSAEADLPAALAAGRGSPLAVEFERSGEQTLALLTPGDGDHERTPLPELTKAWAGSEVQAITTSQAAGLGLPSAGFRITRLYPGSPLAAAGARVGDLLTTLDGQPLKPLNEDRSDEFRQRIRDLEPSQAVRLTAQRKEGPVEFKVTLAEAPIDSSGLHTLASSRLRLQLRELGFFDRVNRHLPANQVGVIVDGVEAGGPAGLAHLQAGDVIVAIAGRGLSDLANYVSVLDQAVVGAHGLIPIQVIRGDEVRILYLDPYWLDAKHKD